MNKIKNFINWKGLILGIIVFLLFYFSSYFQLIPIILLNWDIRSITESQNVMLSTFSNIVLLLILFLIFRKDIIKEWKKFKSNFLENIDTGIKYWLVGLAIMMGSNIIINIVMNLGQAANEQAVQQMISALPWLMFINAGIIAPCTEELIFRKSFRKAFPNKWLFVLISALVFGSLHVVTSMTSPIELLYIIPYGALGGAFAYMYQKTDTIFTSIAMHMFHNSALILLSILV
ncbi:MAG TPA: CPBP family intramembrane metalloprotease [Candidatus Faecimonas intestinavium]|nr:CPBP family intramembrane metalloprotease [Candidatus Faecimonas intestinavium]